MQNFISLSAKADPFEYISAAISPVKLSDADFKHYQETLFPTTNKHGLGVTGIRDFITNVMLLSAGVNASFSFFRSILSNGATIEDKTDEEVAVYIKQLVDRYRQDITTPNQDESFFGEQVVFSTMLEMRTGAQTTIVPSTRYKDGYDILFTGTPGMCGAPIRPTLNATITMTPTGINYEDNRRSNYQTNLSLEVIRVCKDILADMFDGQYTVENLHKRLTVQKPLTFKFTKYNKMFRARTGLDVDLFFTDLDSKFLSKEYQSMFSLALVVDPSASTLFGPWKRYLQNKAAGNLSPETNPRPNNGDLVTQEYMYASPAIGISYAINLERKFVEFACQSKEADLAVYCLHNLFRQWVMGYGKPKGRVVRKGAAAQEPRIRVRDIPRYIVPTANTKQLSEARVESGMHVDAGRTNEDGLTVSPKGDIIYMPNHGEESYEITRQYEETYNQLLTHTFSIGFPMTNNETLNSNLAQIINEDADVERTNSLYKKSVQAYAGSLMAYSWDYNTVLAVGASGTEVGHIDLNGATPPDDLIISDMLGFDFKREGEKDQYKTFRESLSRFLRLSDADDEKETEKHSKEYIQKLRPLVSNGSSLDGTFAMYMTRRNMQALYNTYSYYEATGKALSLEELVTKTRNEMGIDSLANSKLDRSLYRFLFGDNFDIKAKVERATLDGIKAGDVVAAALMSAAHDSSGDLGSNLVALLSEEVGPENVRTEIVGDPRHFNALRGRMADMYALYNYFGGRLFKNMCKAVLEVDRRHMLYTPRSNADPLLGLIPNYIDLSAYVIPMATVFSKYVANYLDYFERAEQLSAKNEMDENVDIDNIIAPGVAEGAMLFPHQVKAQKFLRRRPRYSILDIQAGGGKTVSGLVDIIACADEAKKEGRRFLPVVTAPDGLVKNWCNDLKTITKGRWNVIPITGKTFDEWGPERLAEVITGAPRNTIIAVGINWLKSKPTALSYGPRKVKLYTGVEFLKQFNPTYILLDESHKAKKFDPSKRTSEVHKAIKSVFTMDSIEYARLATGTLVHSTLTDVVGQAALFNAFIYRTPKESGIDLQDPDAPRTIRSRLSKYSSCITIKRKEWAFMLPSPIDVFMSIDLEGDGKPGNMLHATIYQSKMKRTLELIEELKANANKTAATADDDDDDTEEGEESEDLAIEEDEGLSGVDPSMLSTYLQDVEQLITDPWGDVMFQVAAEEQGIKPGDFIPAKIKTVLDRLDVHYNLFDYDANRPALGRTVKWQPGMKVQEYDVVLDPNDGNRYMRRLIEVPFDQITLRRKEITVSDVPPSKDIENWKPEKLGKVLIICRYTRNVEAIYAALPEKYKSRAVRFHGKIADGKANIEKFRTDPDVDILITNEMAISEGYNLQVGSRLIRVDTPWSPGEEEQTAARIFRPDVAAAKFSEGRPGDMAREVIYMDWLMVNGTLEVGKVARLMWKKVANTKFDEDGNPRYESLADIALHPLKMDLELLASKNTVEDFSAPEDPSRNYFGAKALLSGIERQEFAEMRKTTVSEMLPMVIPDLPEDFREMTQAPILPNQEIADTMGFGLVQLDKHLESSSISDETDVEKILKLMPVKTGFGTGVIVGYTLSYKTDPITGDKSVDPDRPITSVIVRYKENDETARHSPQTVFTATKVTPAMYDRFFSTDKPWSTESERKRIEAVSSREEREMDKQRAERDRLARQDKEAADKAVRTVKRTAIRKQNEAQGKPINDGIERIKRVPKVKDEIVDVGSGKVIKVPKTPVNKIKIIPAINNGFITLHVTNNEKEAVMMKKHGFTPYNPFIYIDFKAYPAYEKFIDFVESKFELDRPTEKRLEQVMNVFEDTRKMDFNVRQAVKTASEIPNYFRARLKDSQDKKSLKLYAIVLHDRLRIVADIATNPAARKLIGKAVPGAGALGVFKEHPGMQVFFAANRRTAQTKLKELVKDGFVITNLEKVQEAISELKV